MRRRERVQVSAHRCLTRSRIEHALSLDVDFVEFDVQRCAGGEFMVHHDPTLLVGEDEIALSETTRERLQELAPDLLSYDDALTLLAGRRRAHIDLKASVSHDPVASVAVVARAVDVLGADGFVVTSGDDHTVKAIRDWGDAHGHTLLAGLSLGRNTRGFSLLEQIRIRWSELMPRHRVRHSRASVVVAHHSLALLGVARFARRHDLPLLVWTVNTPRALGHWFRPGRAWLVTTNHPEVALRIRGAERLRS
jgi:glycerophosphoryl diester phosphodiesterase